MQNEKQNRLNSWKRKTLTSNQKYIENTKQKHYTIIDHVQDLGRIHHFGFLLCADRALAERTSMKVVGPCLHYSRPAKCERTCFLLECTLYRMQGKGRSISPTETRQMCGHGIRGDSVTGSVGIPAFRGFMSGIRRLVQDCVGEPMGQGERKPLLIDRQAVCSRACIRRGCTRLRRHRAKLTFTSLHTFRLRCSVALQPFQAQAFKA